MRTRHFSSSDPVPSPLDDARGKSKHRPVLLHEVSAALCVEPDDIVLDATLGAGGHAKELVKGLGGNGLFIGFDADSDAIARAKEALAGAHTPIELIETNFRHLAKVLRVRGIKTLTKVLFDLGWSSYQLNSGRGFSFVTDEPLLMTYEKEGARTALTAREIVNTWSERSLADIIFGFGEERYSRRIAKAIVARRKSEPFATSRELAALVASATPASYRHGRLHPATRTFQALRIAVNDELAALTEGLEGAWGELLPHGRIAVITFHSLEDRVVKRKFAEWVRQGEGVLVTKKPIVPGREEVRENPRARSAKLRVIQKISHESENTKNKQVRAVGLSRTA